MATRAVGQRKEALGKEYLGRAWLRQGSLSQTVNKSFARIQVLAIFLCGPWVIATLSPNRNEGCRGLHLLMRTETRAWVSRSRFSLGEPMLTIHLLIFSLGARTGTLSMWKKENRWDTMTGDQTQTTTDLTRSQSCKGSSLLCLCQGTCY